MTVLTYISSDANLRFLGDNVRTSTRARVRDLRDPTLPEQNMYPLLLTFAQKTWPSLNIQHDYTQNANIIFWGARSAKFHEFVMFNGQRYGCARATRASNDCFAAADCNGTRVPVRILYHFEITISGQPSVICSVVQRLRESTGIPSMPWDI
jgi:hypothetical protein